MSAADGGKKRKRKKKEAALPDNYSLGQKVWFCGAPQRLQGDDRVEYGLEGEVVEASIFNAHDELTGAQKRLSIKFQGNTERVECYLGELSKAWPPPPLPGGFSVGQQVFFRGVRQRLLSGDRVGDNRPGEVVGASSIDPATRVAVRFPDNVNATDCHVDTLSTAPPEPGRSPRPVAGLTAGSDSPPLGASRLDSPGDDFSDDDEEASTPRTPRGASFAPQQVGADAT